MNRPSHDRYFMNIATVVATRSTCSSRQVGCVLVDDRHRLLSSGYNGRPSEMGNCIDTHCRRGPVNSGDALNDCDAVHAEQNALLQCGDVDSIHTCYTTVSPCITCVKLLLNTSCQRIVFNFEYPHHHARQMWIDAGRDWVLT